MRSTTPKLVLQGDVRKAKKWIPWATKALDRMKNLTVTGIANKVLRPVTGVAVHVWSINNIDRIRIVVAQAVGCRNSFDIVPVIYALPYEIGFFRHHWVGSKEYTGFDLRIPGFWLFGDGRAVVAGAIGSQKDHTYPSAGDYDVTLYSFFKDFSEDLVHGVLQSITGSEAIFTIDTTGYMKAFGIMTFILGIILTKDDITITIDGAPVEITTSPSSPLRAVTLAIPKGTGAVMTVVVAPIIPYAPAYTGWMVTHPLFWSFHFTKYKCLAKTTQTITVT